MDQVTYDNIELKNLLKEVKFGPKMKEKPPLRSLQQANDSCIVNM